MVDGSSNRRVKNPKTNAQTLQRVLVKAVGMLYAMLKFICNHSFKKAVTRRMSMRPVAHTLPL